MPEITNIAINGMGRIGRLLFRLLSDIPSINIIAVNDLSPNESLAYLLQYDTAHKKWNKQVNAQEHYLYIHDKKIRGITTADIADLPWKENNIDIVIDCTGRIKDTEIANKHLLAGAKKVIISAPANKEIKTIVMGVNDHLLTTNDTIISNASCTTNCLAPMVSVLEDHFGIIHGIMNTIHAYTGDQKLQDSLHGTDLRRARAAAENIVPTTSNAVSTLEWVLPKMKGKIIGGAMRVPVIVGSLTELYCTLEKDFTVQQINAAFKDACNHRFKNIMVYTEDPIVSSDIIHNPMSCTFDSLLTTKNDTMLKIVGWYDNEFGYANRLAELVLKVSQL